MLAGHAPFGMDESVFTGVQNVDAELGRKFWWCFGTRPKAPERELREFPDNGEITGIYGRTAVSKE